MSSFSAPHHRERERNALDLKIKKFLEAGNKIEECKSGLTVAPVKTLGITVTDADRTPGTPPKKAAKK